MWIVRLNLASSIFKWYWYISPDLAQSQFFQAEKRYHWPGLVLFYIIQGLVLSISHLKHAKFSALRNYVHLCRNISIMYKSRVESMQIRIYFWTCNMSPSFSRVYCYCISSWRYSLWCHDVFKIFDALAGIINSVFR